MRRRSMLQGAMLGVAALGAPAWLRRAFADASMPPCDADKKNAVELPPIETTGTSSRRGPADVGRALERARTRGRPLAVIIVPENEELRRVREEAVGSYLRTGTLVELAPLGGADVICATPSALQRAGVVGSGRADDNTIFARIDPDGAAGYFALKPTRMTAATIASAAASLFPLDGKSLEEKRALGRVAQRLREGPLPGGNWGYTEGCGHHRPADAASTDDVGMIGCGMGSIGGAAHRFLAFYVEERRPTRRR